MPRNGEKKETRTFSVLECDEKFTNKVLSRNSSSGSDDGVHERHGGRVPFKWESLPGTPKRFSMTRNASKQHNNADEEEEEEEDEEEEWEFSFMPVREPPPDQGNGTGGMSREESLDRPLSCFWTRSMQTRITKEVHKEGRKDNVHHEADGFASNSDRDNVFEHPGTCNCDGSDLGRSYRPRKSAYSSSLPPSFRFDVVREPPPRSSNVFKRLVRKLYKRVHL